MNSRPPHMSAPLPKWGHLKKGKFMYAKARWRLFSSF
jgi:hypothetical protein